MREMVMLGQTVTELPLAEAMKKWTKAGPCQCPKPNSDIDRNRGDDR